MDSSSNPIKVLIVDDSALYRKIIRDVFAKDPRIEVLATAPNGQIALMKIARDCPHLITLDMEMPEMDGLATLRELKVKFPKVKTIVFSQHSERGAELTLKALKLGAVDFVTKPGSGGSLEENLNAIKSELLPKVLALQEQLLRHNKIKPRRFIQPFPSRPQFAPREVIAIGISTGGPNSLMTLFEQIPASLKQAILIVQHMPPLFTNKLAEQLHRVGSLPVHEAVQGEPILKGKAYIAPGDRHMEVVHDNGQKFIHLHQGPLENYCRPAVDVLFRSVAEVYGRRAVGVIMTGMGRDGFKGSQAMKPAGAPIIAQDEATSVVWGMPRFIVENKIADAVAPLDKMYETIKQFIL
ncbi:MAG: chemotaxis response regulator protein-glutamate methylesterase [bacterium]